MLFDVCRYNIFLKKKVLNYFFLKQRWVNYVKNSLYFDYGLKFALKSGVYALLIQLAYFFAEKYIIEYNTRYLFNYFSYAFYKTALRLDNNRLLIFATLGILNIAVLLI